MFIVFSSVAACLRFYNVPHNHRAVLSACDIKYMLGAICGSAISMDLLAQSMDPYSAQKSMDVCAIYGFCVADLPIYRFFMPTLYLNLTFMN